MRAPRLLLPALASVLALLVAAVVWLNRPSGTPPPVAATTDPVAQVERGAYLARVGNCAGCHTARGGAAYAGGTAIGTPFGTVYAPNLTPDAATGIGAWSSDAFWRALHDGRAADGRLLAPVCPYPNYTQIGRDDVADLHAYLRSLPPVAQPNRLHALRWPYGTQPALAVWRALYFRPGTPAADRGAYLVGGLGHCSACHGQRNAWGATGGALDLRGGSIPTQGWVAPALDDPREAGVADWPLADIAALLRTGHSPQAVASGPMALVVARSTQHLTDADALAMARFLKALPQRGTPAAPSPPPDAATLALGARLYERHCADCHGAGGEGSPGAVPALAGNRAVVMDAPDNLLRVVLGGGFGPATAARPQPHGMPPYATLLSDAEIAAVVSFLRASWGHRAAPVNALDVNRQRGS
ncbi:c-type cytochrome [Rubrivivax sp. RP6-9]|uniref:c-type cytochrome n=1 Tax=Rubrivivax sp. RP6-9 TaxID=3415750 RepID=UPI003CC508B7